MRYIVWGIEIEKIKGKRALCFVLFLSGSMFLCCPYAYPALVSAHVCTSQYFKSAYAVHMLLYQSVHLAF